MMRRLRVLPLVVMASTLFSPTLWAESNDYPLINPETIQRYGLERVWFTQVPVGAGREGIVGLRLHISATSAQTLYRIKTKSGQIYTISDRNLDAFGKPLGVEGAGKAAADKARLLRLQGAEIDGQIEQVVVPDIFMYVATNSGTVQAIDAETGRTVWTAKVGQIDFPTTDLAVTEDNVAVVNGQQLYILSTRDGSIIDKRRIIGGPAAGPTIWHNTAYVPLLNGHLEAFTFGPESNWWPVTYRSRGSVLFPPTTAGNSVVWANNAGDISVITAGRKGIHYRLRLPDPVAGPILYMPPKQIIGVTEAGYVYSFDLTDGQMIWRYTSGEPSDKPAAMVNDTVYLVTRNDGMHSISAQTGEREWPSPNPLVQQFVAATKKRVYCTTTTGMLAALDADTGQLVGQIYLNPNDRVFENNQTDRIYIATRSGVLQCLREAEAVLPVLHQVEPTKEAPQEEAKGEEGAKKEKTEAGPIDPFAHGAKDEGKAKPSANPFEGGAGGDDSKKSDAPAKNPFGGG